MRINNYRYYKTLEDTIKTINELDYDDNNEESNPYNNADHYRDYSPKIEYINDDPCKIFAKTRKSEDELINYDLNHKAAVSMGRYMLVYIIIFNRIH